jgi:fructose-bisphosphate aldolase class I
MTTLCLENVAGMPVADGKIILAADETIPTLTARFDTLGILSTDHTRRKYGEMVTATLGVAQLSSGVIVHDETARGKSSHGASLIESEPSLRVMAPHWRSWRDD